MITVTELDPKSVWMIFYELTKIPRPSRDEGKAREWSQKWAESHGLDSRTDAYGNLCIYKPASPGYENVPTVVLQGHLDIVCEKNPEVEIDFKTQGVSAVVDGDWVRAEGTTLGADNGMAIALAFALVEDKVPTGPLEFLLTVEEEIGLFGAVNLDASMVNGRMLLNLDSEEWGVITVGCAGGGDSIIRVPITREQTDPSFLAFQVSIGGLQGGHSGVDIDKMKENAVVLLARILYDLTKSAEVRLASFEGGNLHNAIPRSAHCTVAVPRAEAEQFKRAFEKSKAEVIAEWKKPEPELRVTVVQSDEPISTALSVSSSRTVAKLMNAAPHGVHRFSPVIQGLVETSTNLSKARLDDDHLRVEYSTRSSSMSALEYQRKRFEALFGLVDADIEHMGTYPGWEPNIETEWFELVEQQYTAALGEKPKVEAIHAGLETGAIGGKIPDMQMTAIGVTIKGAHSPNECVEIESVKKVYDLVKRILSKHAEQNRQ